MIQFCRKSELFGPPLLYFNFESFLNPNSLSFIRFQYILHDWGASFAEPLNIYKLKTGDLIYGGESVLQKVWIVWSTLVYFNSKSFLDPNSSSFLRFQCILHDSGVLFSKSRNFYKLKRGDLISGGNKFCRKSELFGPPFCIASLKVLLTQIHRHSLDFNALCMIQEFLRNILTSRHVVAV